MIAAAAAFGFGLVFAIGLGVSGMTQPAKVIGFLDFFGSWDPSLALVMSGAIATHATLRPLVMRRRRPLFESSFALTTTTRIDRRLIAGAAIFGVGWGTAGFCPGPALVSASGGTGTAIVFTLAMVAGMIFEHGFSSIASRARP